MYLRWNSIEDYIFIDLAHRYTKLISYTYMYTGLDIITTKLIRYTIPSLISKVILKYLYFPTFPRKPLMLICSQDLLITQPAWYDWFATGLGLCHLQKSHFLDWNCLSH